MKTAQGKNKYKWTKKASIKFASYFYEAEEALIDRHDDNTQAEKHRETCFILDRLVDRFELDVNSIIPAKTGLPPSILLNRIIDMAAVRYIPDCRGVSF